MRWASVARRCSSSARASARRSFAPASRSVSCDASSSSERTASRSTSAERGLGWEATVSVRRNDVEDLADATARGGLTGGSLRLSGDVCPAPKPVAKPYSVLRTPPCCVARACATDAGEANPRATTIEPSGFPDVFCSSSATVSCSVVISPRSTRSEPRGDCGGRPPPLSAIADTVAACLAARVLRHVVPIAAVAAVGTKHRLGNGWGDTSEGERVPPRAAAAAGKT
jgi:hypothetical protein